jgi:hypothetical protein
MRATLPNGIVMTGEFVSGMKEWELNLPEGVCEDEVGVTAEYLTSDYQVAESFVVKYAVERAPEPPADETPEIDDGEELPETEADEFDTELSEDQA